MWLGRKRWVDGWMYVCVGLYNGTRKQLAVPIFVQFKDFYRKIISELVLRSYLLVKALNT